MRSPRSSRAPQSAPRPMGHVDGRSLSPQQSVSSAEWARRHGVPHAVVLTLGSMAQLLLRDGLKLTQKELSALTAIPQSTLSEVERGNAYADPQALRLLLEQSIERVFAPMREIRGDPNVLGGGAENVIAAHPEWEDTGFARWFHHGRAYVASFATGAPATSSSLGLSFVGLDWLTLRTRSWVKLESAVPEGLQAMAPRESEVLNIDGQRIVVSRHVVSDRKRVEWNQDGASAPLLSDLWVFYDRYKATRRKLASISRSRTTGVVRLELTGRAFLQPGLPESLRSFVRSDGLTATRADIAIDLTADFSELLLVDLRTRGARRTQAFAATNIVRSRTNYVRIGSDRSPVHIQLYKAEDAATAARFGGELAPRARHGSRLELRIRPNRKTLGGFREAFAALPELFDRYTLLHFPEHVRQDLPAEVALALSWIHRQGFSRHRPTSARTTKPRRTKIKKGELTYVGGLPLLDAGARLYQSLLELDAHSVRGKRPRGQAEMARRAESWHDASLTLLRCLARGYRVRVGDAAAPHVLALRERVERLVSGA